MRFSWHTMIMLAYIIPNVYLFFRIWKLFIAREYKVAYIFAYLAVVFIFPLSNIIENNAVSHCLEAVSLYLLPFFLYMFLFTLAFDIFLGFNLFLKLMPKSRLKNPQFMKYALLTLIFASALVVIAGVINYNTIRMSEYSIEAPARHSTATGLKIVFVADFHIDKNTPESLIHRFVTKTNSVSPDIVLFAGDIVEGRNIDELKSRTDILKQISARYGVFGVLGNHEYYRGQEKGRFFVNAGIELLRDTVIVVADKFSLAGRLDSHFENRKTVEELLQTAADTLPLIMLDHRPTELFEVAKTKTDIQVSGHTHNGQLFPINLILKRMYILNYGYKKIENTNFFVTSGIRLWRYPVRTVSKSEIVTVNVNFVK